MDFVVILIISLIIVWLGTIFFWLQRYKRCPPDKIMVIYGRTDKGRASKTIHGGAALVWPLIQDYAYLPLTPITINIDLRNALSQQNIRINVPSTFTIGVSIDNNIKGSKYEKKRLSAKQYSIIKKR